MPISNDSDAQIDTSSQVKVVGDQMNRAAWKVSMITRPVRKTTIASTTPAEILVTIPAARSSGPTNGVTVTDGPVLTAAAAGQGPCAAAPGRPAGRPRRPRPDPGPEHRRPPRWPATRWSPG